MVAEYESHTVRSAMARGELTDDEAYFVLRFAGHYGYNEAIKRLRGGLFRRLRRWFIWVGGWETPELMQWDLGTPAWQLRPPWSGKLKDPTPLRLLDRIVFFGWGIQVRLLRRYLVYSRHGEGWEVYISPDGTPSHREARVLWCGRRRTSSER